jgi:hypothetical protein
VGAVLGSDVGAVLGSARAAAAGTVGAVLGADVGADDAATSTKARHGAARSTQRVGFVGFVSSGEGGAKLRDAA